MAEYTNPRLATGAKSLDDLLGGGIEYASLTNVFGPAGAGKTNVALLAAVAAVRAGKKVVFIDTEGGFSPERLAQICNGADFEGVSKKILMMEPKTFKEQSELVKKLDKIVEKEAAGLVVIDSLVALYRLEMGNGGHVEANKKLSEQLSILSKLARDANVPILITNQIYSEFDNRGTIELVSRDVARYWSKCLVELLKLDDKGRRLAVLRKHRSLPEGTQAQFVIGAAGFEEAKPFRLFG
ncbi:MAG: DNA repair and recombination protein RadB [Candidatus Aenigmatarchaeota archaeon]|nr:MAG: DNA repair and recombination protein RadB [Candidatus Aenigmarchaeota archaeon]